VSVVPRVPRHDCRVGYICYYETRTSCMSLTTSNFIVFQHLPEPNRACLVGVYAVTLDPTFLIWNNLRDLVYQTPIPKVPESDSGSFRYTRSRDYQTPTRHALLGSGRPSKTKLFTVEIKSRGFICKQ